MKSLILLVFSLLLITPAVAKNKQPLETLSGMNNAALLLEEDGKTLLSKRAATPMIPASTMKLVTALAALEQWGRKHRFHTDFYVDDADNLYVKGYGDPFLVSEELDLVVAGLKKSGLVKVNDIVTDASLFADKLPVDGRSRTDNPYDAPLSALSANFNTVAIKRGKKGVQPGEQQTPLTPLAREFAAKTLSKKRRKARVNLVTQQNAERYFGELLAEKLRLADVQVMGKIRRGSAGKRKAFYRHRNSKPLSEVVEGMLLSSSNFIANQIFLMMSDKGDGKRLTMQGARKHLHDWVDRRFGWKSYKIIEGSGLSRRNRLSARQLLDVVKAFKPYRSLLPKHKEKVLAKTGTLRGVSSYAGYVNRNGKWQPFSLLINQPVSYNFRKRVAEDLAKRPKLPSICPGSGSC